MAHPLPPVALFGASPGTGNLGVDALCWSTLKGLADRGLTDATVFGYGTDSDIRQAPGPGPQAQYRLVGTRIGKRFWHRNHVARVDLESRAGLRGNPIIDLVRHAGLVLDVSGGDSFTDLYGSARFRAVTLPKRLALRLERPLVLLPQTYGPFENARSRDLARKLVRRASLAYARDPDSFANLQTLLKEDFDPARHREGVDLAFGLPPHPSDRARAQLELARDPNLPLIGINVSGLLANRPETSGQRFGISTGYMDLLAQLLLRLLASSSARVLLVPHVYGPPGFYESDQDACRELLTRLSAHRTDAQARIRTLTSDLTAGETKWIISRMDWFCGTRMHSTIAALSSGVPAAALAYSLKTQGVFTRAGQAEAVIDLRSTSEQNALSRLLHLWRNREQHARSLSKSLPGIQATGAAQLDEITSVPYRLREAAA